jgi:hypothetical protein
MEVNLLNLLIVHSSFWKFRIYSPPWKSPPGHLFCLPFPSDGRSNFPSAQVELTSGRGRGKAAASVLRLELELDNTEHPRSSNAATAPGL